MTDVQDRHTNGLSISSETDDTGYCPECGRPWHATSIHRNMRSGQRRWLVWPMVALGIYLLVSFGPPAWVADHASAGHGTLLPFSLEGPSSQTAIAIHAHTGAPIGAAIPVRDSTEARLGTVIGLAFLATGLGAIARAAVVARRQKRLPSRPETGGSPNRVALVGLGVGVWGFIDQAVRACFQLQLVLISYFAFTLLAGGAPSSWQIIARAVDRSVAVVAAAVHDL